MQIFFIIAFVLAIGIAIFAIQNSDAPMVVMRFLIWKYETSLVYTLLGAIGLGILLTILCWIPRAIKTSLHMRRLKRQIDQLTITQSPAPAPIQEESKS
jgi:uncharacterized integral membrane protein